MDDSKDSGLLGSDDVEELLAADDRATVDVYVPAWKKTLRMRQLTAAEMLIISEAPKADGMFLLISMSVIDASGNRLFKDADRLKGKTAAALAVLQTAGLKLNAMSANAVATAKNA